MNPRYDEQVLTRTSHDFDNSIPDALRPNLERLSQNCGKLEALVGVALSISSGYRCLELNRLLKSQDTSAHVKCNAVDFTCRGLTPLQVCGRIIRGNGLVLLGIDQLIYEGTWVHVGWTNGTPRRECRSRKLVKQASTGLYKVQYPSGIAYADEENPSVDRRDAA